MTDRLNAWLHRWWPGSNYRADIRRLSESSHRAFTQSSVGATIEVNMEGRILLSTPRNSIEQMLARARAVTFGITGTNPLALR